MSTEPLRASFHRAGQSDLVTARRRDGTEVSWRLSTGGARLPHDLVHLVIESGFGLSRGLWGLVDAGADPARINEEASRARGPDRHRGFGEDRRELLMAEGLCAVCWHDPALDDADLCDAAIESCAAFGVEAPRTLTPARVAAVRAAIQQLRARFRRDHVSVSFSFDSKDPESLLAEVLRCPG